MNDSDLEDEIPEDNNVPTYLVALPPGNVYAVSDEDDTDED